MTGQVKEISEPELRFTHDEVLALFTQIFGLQVSGELMSAVVDQTEGWIIGLQLAARSLAERRAESARGLLASLGTDKKRLFEYLAAEVLGRQPGDVQRFLRESSILSTLSAESCDAILGRGDSAAMLDFVEQNNLFAVEVDEGWWRYHHLFRDFLRQQIKREPERLNRLHRSAASYFGSRGDYAQEIGHYLAAADYRGAMMAISKVGPQMLRTSRFDTLTFWLDQIPDARLQEEPDLLLIQAKAVESQGRYSLSTELFERAARAFAARRDGIGLSRVLRSKAYIAAWRLARFTDAIALCREALSYLGPDDRVERADLLSALALCHLLAGNPATAHEAYEETLQLYEEVGDKEGALSALISTGAWIHLLRGDFAGALALLRRAAHLAEQLGSKYAQAECLHLICVAMRFLDRCEEGKQYGERAVALSREIGATTLEGYSLFYLGYAYHGGRKPDLEAARRCFQQSARFGEAERNDRILIAALTGEVLVLRRMGDLAASLPLGEQLLTMAEKATDLWLLATAKTHVGAAMIEHDAVRAGTLLRSAKEIFLRFEDRWSLTCVDFWLAVLSLRTRPPEAMHHLRASLALAQAHAFGFWFVEEHHIAAPLLAAAIAHDVYPEYCARLLEEIEREAPDPGVPRVQEQVEGREHAGPRPDRPAGGDAGSGLPRLRISCLGNFRASVGDRLIQEGEWQRRKVKGLLAYLATARDHTVVRDEVVEAFWGDLEPAAAKANLRKTLHVLRRVLLPPGQAPPAGYVVSEHGLLMLRRELLETIDLDEFTHHIAEAHKAERMGDPNRAADELEAAIALYAGDFLADEPYEEWTFARREHLRSQYLSALERLARWRIDARQFGSAIDLLRRLLSEDQAREDAHVLLIQCLCRAGRRAEAIAQYGACRRVLKQELDVEPSPELRALYRRLLAGEAV
jgi:ATP/maltotriose-dependent transcriptional regulator MalT